MNMGLLKKTASVVLDAPRPQRTRLYASASSLPAGLLDSIFEHSQCRLSWLIPELFPVHYATDSHSVQCLCTDFLNPVGGRGVVNPTRSSRG